MSRDRAERALLRAVLDKSCEDADKRKAEEIEAIQAAVQQGTYNAFK